MPDPFLAHHAYLFLAPLAILEGPLVALLAGFGAGFGYLNPFAAWGILVAGDLIPDLMYYGLGRWGATMPHVRRFATRTRLIRENLPSLEALWRRHPLPAFWSAKLAWGISPALIVSAGLSGIPLWRFVFFSLLVSIMFLGSLVGVGYGLSQVFGYISGILGSAPLYLGLVGGFFLMLFISSALWARKQISSTRATRESNVING